MTRLPSLILSATLLTVLPSQPEVQTCVAVDFTLRAYSGPIHVGNACLSSFSHTGTGMVIEAHDLGDGIFFGDFEVWP